MSLHYLVSIFSSLVITQKILLFPISYFHPTMQYFLNAETYIFITQFTILFGKPKAFCWHTNLLLAFCEQYFRTGFWGNGSCTVQAVAVHVLAQGDNTGTCSGSCFKWTFLDPDVRLVWQDGGHHLVKLRKSVSLPRLKVYCKKNKKIVTGL